jgi:dihydroorotate dehydrogenase
VLIGSHRPALGELDDIVGAARRHRVDGMIVSSTTVARPPTLRDRTPPSRAASRRRSHTQPRCETYVRVEGAFDLMASADRFRPERRLKSGGASLVGSPLVFHGHVSSAASSRFVSALRREGAADIRELVGLDAAAITAEKWPVALA